jgi:putative thioredoxin
MFHKGEVIAEFAGALPRTSILNWLEEHLPNETKASLEEILQRLQQDDPLALKELQSLVVDYPEIKEARLALAQQVVFTDPVQALQLIQDFAEGYKFYDEANYLKELVNFMQFVPTDDSEVGKKIVAAQLAAEQKDLESTIQLIIDAVSLNKDYNGALPRKTGVAIFRTLGTTHQLTKSYRWKFDMMLY